MNTQTDSKGQAHGEPPLVAFEDQLGALCREDKYREMAESFASFVKAHAGITYLAFEPIPAKISDHLIKKTQSPSAFITLTLRKPTWVNELSKSLSDPSAFEANVKSLETEVLEIAKQTKKLS
jgi:hypothetical protein